MRTTLALILAFALGALTAGTVGVRAQPQPTVDRQLVERGVRALEAQVKATEALTRAEERCRR